MKLPNFLLAAVWILGPAMVQGADLSPEQIESLRRRLSEIKQNLDGHISNRNQGARSIFMEASKDSKVAVNLYLECYKKVNYDMEGRSESDFRAWKDSQSDRLRSDQFVESLLMQLRYLALSCHAAEIEEIHEVFGPLTNYLESLSNLKELPDGSLTSSVASSIFAQAFDLEKLLGQNDNWEPVPFNITGIYDKTILPYLRANNKDSLMAAWDKRIEQEKRIVLFFEARKKEELRGMDRERQRRQRDRQDGRGGIMRSHDIDDFTRETLPRLQWSKMKDLFQYIDQFEAAKQMLTFIEERLKTKNGEFFYNDFIGLLEESQNPSSETETEDTPAPGSA